MLPEGWTVEPLGKLAVLERGRFSARPRNDPKYYGGKIPFVQTGDVANAGFFLQSHSQTINELGLTVSKVFPTNTILMTIAANIGATAITRYPVACPDSVVGISARPKKADVCWLKYALEAMQSSLEGMAGQNAQKNINLQVLEPLPIIVPPTNEQKRIGEVLLCWDNAIATVEKLLVNSRKQKQALMQKLLTGERRLPGFKSKWKKYRLGQLFTERIETGRVDLPLLSITREDGVIPRDDVGRKDTSNDDKSKYLRICPGDIGYNTMRMWQGVSALSFLEGIISPAYTVVVPSHLIDGKFAAHLFKFERTIFSFYRYSQGLVSDTWNLKYPHFSEVNVEIPERTEQEAIVEVLTAADAQIEILKRKLVNMNEEKHALMHLLLSGKRRVRAPEPDEKAAA